MNMYLIDWVIVGAILALLVGAANYTKRYNRSVADFLVANRCAGRYLLAVAGNMAAFGAISILAWYEMFYEGGFGAAWWHTMTYSVPIIAGVSGWLVYRYRQTRAMTLAQFFEMRYNKKFRIFSGMLCCLSGILNFGVFPAVGARFFIYFCGLPHEVNIFGFTFATFTLLLIILISIALYFTFAGGLITVMVTDFIQGTICDVLFLVMIVYLVIYFDWSQISAALLTAPEGESLVNPYDSQKLPDFNMWYFIIAGFGLFYNYMSWQGSGGFNAAAINATEQKMGKALHYLRNLTQTVIFLLIAVCAYTVMHHSDFSSQAEQANGVLNKITDPILLKQLRVPIVSATFLCKGLLGCMCAIVLTAFISTHETYLHSWGSILIQDVILPFRKKPLTPKQHMRWLRWSILGVAVFILFWSRFFRLNESILMYFAITGAIYLGGAGPVIAGGLYWKKGTTAAAWWTMICGSIIAVSGLLIRPCWEHLPILSQRWEQCPINSAWIYLIGMTVSTSLYIVVSLLTCKRDFNMDRMLHRGKYADEESEAIVKRSKITILEKLGIEKTFSRHDKFTYAVCIGWPLLVFTIVIVGTIYNLVINKNVSDEAWLKFWHIWIGVTLVVVTGTTIWFIIGGFKNLIDMFRRLNAAKMDTSDDGTVVKTDEAEE